MKKIAGIFALAAVAILTSCGGADSDTSPFVGKIDFKADMMGMSTKGSVTMDAENERMTYRLDALELFMGMDMAMMVDMKKKMTYAICESKGIYMETPMKDDDMKKDLPTKEEVEKAKKEFFSKLKKTGNTKEILGLTCDEYVLNEKAEGMESATIWVSKTMLDRMTANLSMMDEMKKLGADELFIGLPMKGTFQMKEGKGSFEVTKITEGEEALADFDLSKMKKLSPEEFSKIMMEDSAFGNLVNGIDDMEQEGFMEGLEGDMESIKKDLEGLKNVDTEELEKMLKGLEDLDPKEMEKLMEALK